MTEVYQIYRPLGSYASWSKRDSSTGYQFINIDNDQPSSIFQRVKRQYDEWYPDESLYTTHLLRLLDLIQQINLKEIPEMEKDFIPDLPIETYSTDKFKLYYVFLKYYIGRLNKEIKYYNDVYRRYRIDLFGAPLQSIVIPKCMCKFIEMDIELSCT